MSTKSDKTKVIGQVLTYDPESNKSTFLDYVDKSVHTKHEKMYLVTTKRGYEIKVTDDHSLITTGTDSLFTNIKPEKAVGKFVPVIHEIEYEVSPEDELKAEKYVIKLLKEDSLYSFVEELLLIDKTFLEVLLANYFIEDPVNPELEIYDYKDNAELQLILLCLARCGKSPYRIHDGQISIHKQLANRRYIPVKDKLLLEDEVRKVDPANMYLNTPYTWDEVESVEVVSREDITYDFTVPKFPVFVANGIVVFDTMMVHVPSSAEARQEALDKMLPSKNIFHPRTLTPLLAPQQEHLFGLYMASKDIPGYISNKVKARDVMDMDSLLQDIKMGKVKPNEPVKYQGHLTTAGMAIINSNLPFAARNYEQVWDKKYMSRVLDFVGKNEPSKYPYIAQLIKELGALYGYKLGVTFKQSDFDLQKLKKMRDAYFKKVETNLDKIQANKSLSKQDKDQQIGAELRKAQAFAMNLTDNETNSTFNRWYATGSKGSAGQIQQIIASPTVVADPKNRLIPSLIGHSYLEGLTPAEYFTSSYGTRKGSVSAKLSVAPSGGLSKELIANTLDLVISCKNCNTPHGILRNIEDKEDILYRVEAGTNKFIDPNYYEQLKRQHKTSVMVRSPATCEAREGVCQYCYGFNERFKFPDIGENVGINAVHAVSEPLTQLGLSSKHTAGTAAADTVGFNTIKAFYNMSSKFSGSAVISEVSGRIEKIEQAPTGGTNVWVGKKKYYIPPARTVKVKIGDQINAGEPLSDGILTFSNIVPYKGIAKGREGFIEHGYDLYNRAGQHSIRKNFEVIARGLINYVEITNPNDYDEYVEGDIVEYNKLQADIRSHPGRKAPDFVPYQKGTNKSPTFKRDWLDNFGFKFLKSQLINNAATFSKSMKHQYNPIAPYARGAGFSQAENGKY